MLGIYCRVSKERKNQVSIETQQAYGIDFASENGFQYDVYIDSGISGRGKSDKRPEYTRLCNDIKSGRLTAVYIYERSRNDRDIGTWVQFAELVKENKIPLYIKGKEKNLRDLDTYYQLVQYAIYDQKYADETAEKIKDALLTNVKNGKAFSVTPYGYKKGESGKLEINEIEVEIIKEIYKQSLSGKGIAKIAEELNYNGVESRRNGKWAGRTISGIIENTIYKGLRYWQGKYYKAPPIITAKEWQEIYDNFKHNNIKQGRKIEHKILLRGIVKCGKCGLGYYGRTRESKKDHYYMCVSKRRGYETCGNRSIHIDYLDAIIWWQFNEGILLDSAIQHFKKDDTNSKIDQILKEIKELDKRISKIESGSQKMYDDSALGILDFEKLSSAIHKANNVKKGFESQKSDLERQLVLYRNSIDKDELLDELIALKANTKNSFEHKVKPTFERMRDVIERFIKKITIHFVEDKYYIEIKSTVQGLEPIIIQVDKNYTIAHNLDIESSYLLKDISKRKLKTNPFVTKDERSDLKNQYLEFINSIS